MPEAIIFLIQKLMKLVFLKIPFRCLETALLKVSSLYLKKNYLIYLDEEKK